MPRLLPGHHNIPSPRQRNVASPAHSLCLVFSCALQASQLKSSFSNNTMPKTEATTKYANIIARPSGIVALYEDNPAVATW